MRTSLSPLIFAASMIALGVASTFFPYRVLGLANKMGGKRIDPLRDRQAIPSIRFGGIVELLMGTAIIWILWRNA